MDIVKTPDRELATRRLTQEQFQGLAEIPPELEWFANLRNANTRRAYQRDLEEFREFTGIRHPEEFRLVTRAHIIAWRSTLEERGLAAATVRRKLSALSSLFNYLCEQNAVPANPTQGITRPNEGSNQGKTPAISDDQAVRLLDAPDAATLKGKRDRAILSVLLYHGLRREELCTLRVCDVQERQGIMHLVVAGKGDKLRYLPVHFGTLRAIAEYLVEAGHDRDFEGPLFRRVKGQTSATRWHAEALHPESIRQNVVRHYGADAGIDPSAAFSPHALRATASTNAIEGGADLKKVQDWLGHANVSTTVMYDRRRDKPEDSPTYKVDYKRKPKSNDA